ncbi:MAG: hypothetical protein R2849_07610 [Thermomicrobiales bacterium]
MRDLRASGKTLIIVHHNLETVLEYFDWVVLLNVQAASGPAGEASTLENIRKAAGGRIAALNSAERAPRSIAPF